MKMAIKRENDAFFLITLKRVSGVTSHLSRPKTPKLWAIAHENGHKTQKRRVSYHNSQICIISLQSMQMPLEPENYGQIAHEYSPNIRKRRVFGHVSQTCIGFYGACK